MAWADKKRKKDLQDYLRERVYTQEDVGRLLKKLELEAKVEDTIKKSKEVE